MSTIEDMQNLVHQRSIRYDRLGYDPLLSQAIGYLETEDKFLEDLARLLDDSVELPWDCDCDGCKDKQMAKDGAV